MVAVSAAAKAKQRERTRLYWLRRRAEARVEAAAAGTYRPAGGIPKYDYLGVILPAAAEYIRSKPSPPDLRTVFYHLAAKLSLMEITNNDYALLSQYTTKARDGESITDGKNPKFYDGVFPELNGEDRPFFHAKSKSHPGIYVSEAIDNFRLSRGFGQPHNIFVGVEKVGYFDELWKEFAHLGVYIFATKGTASQTLRAKIVHAIDLDWGERPAVLIYGGDFDPSGVMILRSLVEKVNRHSVAGGFGDRVRRVAVNIDQIDDLPFNPEPERAEGKRPNPNIPAFEAEFGDELEAKGFPRHVQYEINAMEPEDVIAGYQAAIDEFYDYDDAEAKARVRQERMRRAALDWYAEHRADLDLRVDKAVADLDDDLDDLDEREDENEREDDE